MTNLSLVCYATESCGLKGSVQQRIKDCNETRGNFVVVAYHPNVSGFGIIDVIKDLDSGLLWSRAHSALYTGGFMDHYQAVVGCTNGMGEALGIDAEWRLPSIDEYKEAERNGIRSAIRGFEGRWWSSDLYNEGVAWLIKIGRDSAREFMYYRFYNDVSARCVGIE